MKDFKGKIGFVTGGGAGLGLGIAKVFTEAGAKMVIADIRQDHLDEAMETFKGTDAQVHAIQLDITDRKAFAEAADEVERVFGGPPQLLFNNAGVNTFGPVEASTYDDWDWLLNVNLYGVINGMMTFVERMIKSEQEGYIVTTSSIGGFFGSATAAPYSAAKAAVINMMESYKQSLSQYNIGVSVCCPGNINSKIYDAVSTRPDHLKKTGYHVNESTKKSLEKIHAHGMDPVDLANLIKEGVETEKMYICPPGSGMMLERHFKEIMDDQIEMSPEELQKMREMMAQGMKPKPGEEPTEPFGLARKDLGWVKTPRFFQGPPPEAE